MPHIKGNKFKPAPGPTAAQEPASAAPTSAAVFTSHKQGKTQTSGQQQHQNGQQQNGLGNDSHSSQHPRKKQKLTTAKQQAPQHQHEHGNASQPKPAGHSSQQLSKRRKITFPTSATTLVEASVAAAGSNWAALQETLAARRQRKHVHIKAKANVSSTAVEPAVPAGKAPGSKGSNSAPTKIVALDCEMVGTGPDGATSILARVCLINSAGNVLLDTFVRPTARVTDFRTKVSGVRPADLKQAPAFEEVHKQLAELLQGRILIGHTLENDLAVLLLSHPRKDTRDTGAYPPLMKVQGMTGKLKPRALRHLAKEELGLQIQAGEHSPVDDARAALYLYQKHRKAWEQWLQQGGKAGHGHVAGGAQHGGHMTLAQLAANAEYMHDC